MNRHEESPWEEDREALRASARQGLPGQADTARAVQARLARASREGLIMKLRHAFGARPFISTAVSVAVVAAILLILPISYERTVGYDVRLGLPGMETPQGQDIADEFGKLLGTSTCAFDRQGSEATAITARVPMRSRRVLQGLAMGYTQALAMRGIAARPRITPVRERLAGNVYTALASEMYQIRVSRDGKTNEQLAQEIREQFEAAGLPGAVVTVTGEGDQIRMEMQWTAPPGYSGEGEKRFDITIDGGQ